MVNEPPREMFLRAVVAVLHGLTGIRPRGFSYPVKPTVSRRYRQFVETMEWPYLIVSQASNSKLDRLIDISNDYQHDFRFSVVGYVKGSDLEDDTPSTWALRLQDDVTASILGSDQLVADTGVVTVKAEEDRTDEGEEYPFAMFEQFFTAVLPEAIYTAT